MTRALLLLLVVAAGSARAERTIAILPLQSIGLSEDALLSVEGVFREAIRTTPGVRLQERAATLAGLARARDAGVSCDVGDDACLQGLAGVLEVGEIVSGTVSEDPHRYGLALKLLNAATGASRRKGPSTIAKDPAQLYVGMRRAAAELLEVYTGALEVALDAPGARVVVDGVERGTTPVATLDDVPVGTRRVEVHLNGATWAGDVEVKLGERVRVALAVVDGALVEASSSPVAPPAASSTLPSWTLVGIGAGVVAVGAASLVAGLGAFAVADGAYQALVDEAGAATPDAAAIDSHAQANMLWSLFPAPLYFAAGALGVAGVATAAAGFFVDPFSE